MGARDPDAKTRSVPGHKDETGRTQCIVDRQTQPDLANLVASLTRESVVRVSGTVVAGPDPGAAEIHTREVLIQNRSTPPRRSTRRRRIRRVLRHGWTGDTSICVVRQNA
jgi:aspartyl/asparaginyl-tRNA synthetase